VIPIDDGDRRTYSRRSRQLLLAGSLVALYLAGLTLIFEPDPDTGLLPLPSDYVWVVGPAAILIAVLAWRSLKARVVTDSNGVDIIRVVGHEVVPWTALRRFEVHPTPGKQGFAAVARLHNERLVTVWTEIVVRPVRDRDTAKASARDRAQALVSLLEADRLQRAGPITEASGQPARA
jgi:hypothetical protein